MSRSKHRSGDSPKVPIFSEEAERAVLASVLLVPESLESVLGRLEIEDLYLERHQVILRAMISIRERGEEIDLRTVQAGLEMAGAFEIAGGMAYLSGMDLDLPDLGRLRTYIEIVKERSVRRALVALCERGSIELKTGGSESMEVLSRMQKDLLELGQQAATTELEPMGEVMNRTVVEIENRTDRTCGLSTGFHDFDRMTQGLGPGNLVIVAGRPGMGKTSFAMNVAQNVARAGGGVAVFSLEMGRSEIGMRLIASESCVPFRLVRSGDLGTDQWTDVYDCARRLSGIKLWVDDSSSPGLPEIAAKCRSLMAKGNLSMVVIDYLQLMGGNSKYENRQLEIAAISRGLKQLAKELNIPIMALSQLSRQTERRGGDHRPKLSDLRESGAIEQDADMVCFVYRDEVYNPDDPANKGLAELIIAKHRNGQTGHVDLVFVGELATFRNLEHRYQDQGFQSSQQQAGRDAAWGW